MLPFKFVTTTDNESPTDVVKSAISWTDKLWDKVADADMWFNILFSSIRIVIIFIITRIVIKIVSRIIDRTMARKQEGKIRVNPRRFITVGELMKNATSITCNFIMILLLLSEINVKVGPLLASAGVLGLAIGFGAQGLVKDVITGFFIILEDQFAVGDVIQTGTYKGTVEVIGLRTTKLVSWQGEVHIIPNGTIASVTNFSMSNSLAVVDIPMKGDQSLDESVHLVKRALAGIEDRDLNIVKIPDVLGIQSMSTSEYVVRIVAECLPNSRASVERQIQGDVKKTLEYHEMSNQAALEQAAAQEKDEGDGTGGA
ncbi:MULTISPECIES: mechanosensitive ion channel family protein [unclassified Paenibacillus]|uniref:mechanosensitive ion channel family protein n=1 Tax=unclassified Paenibacillus TaxID=185978 RepID=UPI000414AD32|nr:MULTISPECIES: mechanosensitive ion channel family protein [unclassified Paenibacillus]KGP80581.1 mechanosensitive ion channel protein MscS [Paenibacillus sp. MAEPY1]KGP83374.1 mechanosensitive ion channel protein MscS [Paenibacillus sp. MAEPY2]